MDLNFTLTQIRADISLAVLNLSVLISAISIALAYKLDSGFGQTCWILTIISAPACLTAYFSNQKIQNKLEKNL